MATRKKTPTQEFVGDSVEQAQTQEQVKYTQGQEQRARHNPGGFSEYIQSIGISGLNLGFNSKDFEAFVQTIKDTFSHNQGKEFRVVPVDSDELYVPLLGMCIENEEGVFVYTLLPEALIRVKADPVHIERPYAMGKPPVVVDLPVPAHRYFDDLASKLVRREVAATFEVREDQVIMAGCCVIPVSVRLDNQSELAEFLRSAVAGLKYTAYPEIRPALDANALMGRYTDSNGVVHEDPTVSLNQRITVTPGGTSINHTGRPVATDYTVKVDLTVGMADNRNRTMDSGVHIGTRRIDICEARGFVDFIPVVDAPVIHNQYNVAPHRPGFSPVGVITELAGLGDRNRPYEGLNPQLLGLASAANALMFNRGWLQIFRDTGSRNSNKTSMGYLGMIHDPFLHKEPEYKKIEIQTASPGAKLKEGTMTPEQFADLYLTNNLILALDVELGGTRNWIQEIFIEASGIRGERGAAKRTEANRMIFEECDRITGGLFASRWKSMHNGLMPPAVVNDVVVVETGIYHPKGKADVVCDIRSIDLPTLAAACGGDREMFNEAITALIPGKNGDISNALRHRALLKLTANQMEVTGEAVRVFFTPGFFGCLLSAMHEAGIKFTADGLIGYSTETYGGVGVSANFGDVMTDFSLYRGNSYGMVGDVNAGKNWYVNSHIVR